MNESLPAGSSAGTPETAARPGGAVRVLRILFALATILFVLLGAVIVLGQAVLLAAGAGHQAFDLAEGLGPWAFGASTVAGLLAFALTYVRAPGEEAHAHD